MGYRVDTEKVRNASGRFTAGGELTSAADEYDRMESDAQNDAQRLQEDV